MRTKNSLIKKRRVMNYFLDAAAEIAEETGIESITIRSVAERAGYNSATLYNYFENLEQLIAFTAIRCVSDYHKEISQFLHHVSDDPVNSLIKNLQCYCEHSFAKPFFFAYVYASDVQTMNSIQLQLPAYLEAFPDTFDEEFDEEIRKAYYAPTNKEHNEMWLQPFMTAAGVSKSDSHDILEFISIFHNGLLLKAMTLKDKTPQEYTDIFMEYFIPFLKSKIPSPEANLRT